MWQQGQAFKLKAKSSDGQPLWAYRYGLDGRGSARPQVGGFATRADALKALEKVLERLGPHRALALSAPDPPAISSMRAQSASGAIAIRRRDLLAGLIHEYEAAAAA